MGARDKPGTPATSSPGPPTDVPSLGRPSRWRRWRRPVITATLVVLATVIGLLAFVAHLVLSPRVDPVPERADAIVVFAGESSRLELAERLVAEGRADVLVISNGMASPGTAARCGRHPLVTVLCPTPDPFDTRGEARMFARLAQEHGWHDLIAVTGNYHVARARLLLERCWTGGTTFVPVAWHHVGAATLGHEVGGLLEAAILQRGC